MPSSIILTPDFSCVNDADEPVKNLVQFILCMDPKIAVAPTTMINWSVRNISHYIIHAIRKQAVKIPGSEYEARIKANGPFYAFLRKRLDELRETNKLKLEEEQQRQLSQQQPQQPPLEESLKGEEVN